MCIVSGEEGMRWEEVLVQHRQQDVFNEVHSY
jgi:hypothetical protein